MQYQLSPLVDDYIAQFDTTTQRRLQQLRQAIQAAFPKTIEDISYGIPTYRPAPGRRGVVHFACHTHHIGIYGILDFDTSSELYEKIYPHLSGRGTLQFPNNQPFPTGLIRRVLAYHASKYSA